MPLHSTSGALERICIEPGCDRKAICRQRCESHYRRWLKANRTTPLPPRPPVIVNVETVRADTVTAERFQRKVSVEESGCWLYLNGLDQDGYGIYDIRGHSVRAHRYAYLLWHGPIPEGLQLDHLCRVRNCVNPAHLEPVTSHENQRRSPHYKTFEGRDTCFRNHTLADCYYKADGRKICKTCLDNATRARRQRERALRDATS